MTQEQINFYRSLISDKDYMDKAAKEMAKRYIEDLTKPKNSTHSERVARYRSASS